MDVVFENIGVKKRKLPFANTTKHKHYSSFYSRDEIEKVQKLYKDDIKNHGYTFELKEKVVKNTPKVTGIFSKMTKNIFRCNS